jgi:hypothetical protein
VKKEIIEAPIRNIMKINKYSMIVLILFNMTSVVAQSFNLDDVDAKLNKIYDDDQQIRAKMMNSHKNNLPNVREIVAEMDSIDLHNQQYVSNLLDNYGWPDSLSERANNAIWLVIDHANNQFAEKYFPLVKEKGEQGLLRMFFVATLEDRILMRNNKKQKYGTQTVERIYEGERVAHEERGETSTINSIRTTPCPGSTKQSIQIFRGKEQRSEEQSPCCRFK